VCNRTIGDRIGEAKAHGNIGNTLKVLGIYDDAMTHCEQHLSLTSQLSDKVYSIFYLFHLIIIIKKNCVINTTSQCNYGSLRSYCVSIEYHNDTFL